MENDYKLNPLESKANNIQIVELKNVILYVNTEKKYIFKKIYADRTEYHGEDGKLHRDDGPAVEYKNGTKFYYKNGLPHRENGPAREMEDGRKQWYANGIFIKEENKNV